MTQKKIRNLINEFTVPLVLVLSTMYYDDDDKFFYAEDDPNKCNAYANLYSRVLYPAPLPKLRSYEEYHKKMADTNHGMLPDKEVDLTGFTYANLLARVEYLGRLYAAVRKEISDRKILASEKREKIAIQFPCPGMVSPEAETAGDRRQRQDDRERCGLKPSLECGSENVPCTRKKLPPT